MDNNWLNWLKFGGGTTMPRTAAGCSAESSAGVAVAADPRRTRSRMASTS
jgi:hypothetical protein